MNKSLALIEGLQTVGTGKKGSKDCSEELSASILKELQTSTVSPVSRAAFFSALYLKELAESEKILAQAFAPGVFESPESLAQALAPDAPEWVQSFCAHLLKKNYLTHDQSYVLGQFLFSEESGDSARGMIASILRMRHTEAWEYSGILKAMHERLSEPFIKPLESQTGLKPLIQLAEPFDGLDRSTLITPLLAQSFIKKGYRVLTLVGESSGPKFGMNGQNVAEELSSNFIKSNQELLNDCPETGWVCRQEDLSSAIYRWVELRKQTVKRPFLATLEKFLNPWNSQIFIASAFHHGFTDKMVETAEAANFPAIAVTFKGLEGSLGLSLARSTQIVASVKLTQGYERRSFEFRPEKFGMSNHPDQKIPPDAKTNADLILKSLNFGTSGDLYFDAKVSYALKVYEVVLDWIREVQPQLRG